MVLWAAAGCARQSEASVGDAEIPAPAGSSIPVTSPAPTNTAPSRDPKLIPVEEGTTLTATPKGKVPGYDGPEGTVTQQVTDLYYDRSTKLPVIDQVPGWLRVRLAPKPNGSTVWLRAADVEVGSTPWKIVINLTTTHLQLYEHGEQVLDAPVGVGADATPTATGEFFVTFMQPAPSSSYGPWVMVTSGHSNVIQVWEGFPDGILAIHGPVGAEGVIGNTGARLSNGCIRMRLEDQKKLTEVQPGSPIWIIA